MLMHPEHYRTQFMFMAEVQASNSRDPKRQVGAVIVTRTGNHYFTGYNKFPPRIKDDERWHDERKHGLVVHAELTAIMAAGPNAQDAAIYVTSPPCLHCARHVIAAGIVEIHAKKPHKEGSKWQADWDAAELLYAEASIPFITYE